MMAFITTFVLFSFVLYYITQNYFGRKPNVTNEFLDNKRWIDEDGNLIYLAEEINPETRMMSGLLKKICRINRNENHLDFHKELKNSNIMEENRTDADIDDEIVKKKNSNVTNIMKDD